MFYRRFLTIFIVISICLSLISCQNGMENKKITKPEKPITLAEEYPNLPVGLHTIFTQYNQGCMVIARFPKEIESVKFGNSKGEILLSQTLPQGKFWMNYLNINDFGDVIIGKPKDGTEQIIYESKLDYSNVNCKILYDPHNYEKQIITLNLIGDQQISKAQIDINGTLLEMKQKDKYTYQLEVVLPNSPSAKMYVFNDNDILFKIVDLQVAKSGEARKYFLSGFGHERRPDICSTNNNGQDFMLEYLLDIPKPVIEDEEKYPTHPFNPDGSGALSLISVSPDCRYFFLESEWARPSYTIEENIFAFGKRVQNTAITEYIIFDSQTRAYHSIDSYYRYMFFPTDSNGSSLLEKGNVICPVKWYDDRLVCSLITKEAKQVSEGDQSYGKLNFEAGVEDAFSPYATAKGIEIDLNSFTYKETDEFKPLSPFISFADDSTDIIGYDDIFDKEAKKRLSMSWTSLFNRDFTSRTNIVTDYKNTKQYVISDLFKNVAPKGYIPYTTIYCGSSIEKEKRMLYFLFYGRNIKNIEKNLNARGEDVYVHQKPGYYLFFKLDFDSGNIIKIIEYHKPENKNLPVDYALHAHFSIGTGYLEPIIWTNGFSYNLLADGSYFYDDKQIKDTETRKHLMRQHYFKDGKLNVLFTGEVPFTGGFIRQVP